MLYTLLTEVSSESKVVTDYKYPGKVEMFNFSLLKQVPPEVQVVTAPETEEWGKTLNLLNVLNISDTCFK